MRLLPRRALVALGLALSFVVSAAAPASATNTLTWTTQHTDFSTGFAAGDAYINSYQDPANSNRLSEETLIDRWGDDHTCEEVWIDYFLDAHRPADVFTNCRGAYYSGVLPIHWPRSGSNPGTAVSYLHETNGTGVKVTICKVDVRYSGVPGVPGPNPAFYNRTVGATCQNDTTLGGAGSVAAGSYQSMPLESIASHYGCWPTSGCTGSGGADLLPEYLNHGNIDLLGTDDNMGSNQLLVSWDGRHRLVMQADGNLRVFNASNVATWSMSSCLASGHSLIAGSHAVVQASDGNVVVYGPANQVVWASSNVNGCTHGSLGGSGQYLKMQDDGNLVEYYNGGSLWNTGTAGL